MGGCIRSGPLIWTGGSPFLVLASPHFNLVGARPG